MEGRDILKAMAQQAKDRLRGKANNVTNISYGKNFVCQKTNVKTVIIDLYDEKLNNKIKNIIETENVCPLNELIDFAYYKTLSKEQKERYFFTLADKYREYKQRLENQKIKQVF